MPNWFDGMDMLDAGRIYSTWFMVQKNAELQQNSGKVDLESGQIVHEGEDYTPEGCKGEGVQTTSYALLDSSNMEAGQLSRESIEQALATIREEGELMIYRTYPEPLPLPSNLWTRMRRCLCLEQD